ncbi:unnamed protein product [Choristocarpus tenellus]
MTRAARALVHASLVLVCRAFVLPSSTLSPALQARSKWRCRGSLNSMAGVQSEATIDSVAEDRVDLGGLKVSPLGIGAWAWGDTAFWGYSEAMDLELQEVGGKLLLVDALFTDDRQSKLRTFDCILRGH